MVRIIWQDIALEQLKKHLEYSATEQDTVFVDYIWDTRMNPVKLVRLYKNK